MFDIAPDSHLQCSCKRLEYAFYLVMFVGSLGLDIQIHLCSIRKAFEEVHEHFGRHFANLLAFEFSIPYKPWAAAEVQGNLTKTVVHGKCISVSFYSALVTQCLEKACPKCKCSILDCVMLVHMQVSIACDSEVDVAMLG